VSLTFFFFAFLFPLVPLTRAFQPQRTLLSVESLSPFFCSLLTTGEGVSFLLKVFFSTFPPSPVTSLFLVFLLVLVVVQSLFRFQRGSSFPLWHPLTALLQSTDFDSPFFPFNFKVLFPPMNVPFFYFEFLKHGLLSNPLFDLPPFFAIIPSDDVEFSWYFSLSRSSSPPSVLFNSSGYTLILRLLSTCIFVLL